MVLELAMQNKVVVNFRNKGRLANYPAHTKKIHIFFRH